MVIPKLGKGIMLIDVPGEDMPSVSYGKGEVRNVQFLTLMVGGIISIKQSMLAFQV